MQPKMLVVDIESNGVNAFKADLGYITHFGYQDLDEDDAHCIAIHETPTYKKRPYDDKELVKRIHAIMSKYNVVMGQFSSRFDLLFLQSRFVHHGLPAIPNIFQIDLWRICKSNFKLSSNRLDNIAQFLGVKHRKMSKGKKWWELWQKVAAGDVKTSKFIQKYCAQDVVVTKACLLKVQDYWPKNIISTIINLSTRPVPKSFTPTGLIEPKTVTRLMSKFSVSMRNRCWLFTGCKAGHTPRFKIDGESTNPCRLVYEAYIGKMPLNRAIQHICKNPYCGNPAHLYIKK